MNAKMSSGDDLLVYPKVLTLVLSSFTETDVTEFNLGITGKAAVLNKYMVKTNQTSFTLET